MNIWQQVFPIIFLPLDMTGLLLWATRPFFTQSFHLKTSSSFSPSVSNSYPLLAWCFCLFLFCLKLHHFPLFVEAKIVKVWLHFILGLCREDLLQKNGAFRSPNRTKLKQIFIHENTSSNFSCTWRIFPQLGTIKLYFPQLNFGTRKVANECDAFVSLSIIDRSVL